MGHSSYAVLVEHKGVGGSPSRGYPTQPPACASTCTRTCTMRCMQVGKLRGHTENVRSLLLNADGSLMLSGGADGCIKLWDVGMQRCVQVGR